jgi:hypothetical protein
MTTEPMMKPRKSVPAPELSWSQRMQELVLSPNAIRTASVAAFLLIWEYYGPAWILFLWLRQVPSSMPRCSCSRAAR